MLFWSSKFVLPLPKDHQFPMRKYELVKRQLIDNHIVNKSCFIEPHMASIEDISMVHDLEYIERVFNGTLTDAEIRRIGFPFSKDVIERERLICGAMIDASLKALQCSVSFNMAGGTHHAFSNFGSAYCVFNDMAIAARYLLFQKLAQKVMIVDLDVHQGNGTASIFKNEPYVFVFNVFAKAAYPLRKQKSDLDIELPNGINNQQYIDILSVNLVKAIASFKPDIVLYQAGVDLLWCDKLGKFSMTLDGLKKRDELVLQTFTELNIPVAICLGGGYSPNIQLVVDAHCNTVIAAKNILKKYDFK